MSDEYNQTQIIENIYSILVICCSISFFISAAILMWLNYGFLSIFSLNFIIVLFVGAFILIPILHYILPIKRMHIILSQCAGDGFTGLILSYIQVLSHPFIGFYFAWKVVNDWLTT
jgi:hypothetical protein